MVTLDNILILIYKTYIKLGILFYQQNYAAFKQFS